MNNNSERRETVIKKVIVKQRDQADCGICCLASIIQYYKGYVPIEKIREDTKTTSHGTSAYHMVETLKKYGFDAYGTRIKKEDIKKISFPLPAIVHVVLDNGQNHFMVLYEIHKEKFVLMDPSIGKRVMKEEDFLWIFSEVLLIAYPKETIKILGKEKTTAAYIWKFLGNEKRNFIKLIGLELLLVGVSILGTFYLKIAIKYVDYEQELMLISIFFLFIILTKIILTKETIVQNQDLKKQLDLFHTTNFLNHVQKLPLKIYTTRHLGDYLNRFWENENIKEYYLIVIKDLFICIITIYICFLLLFWLEQTFFHCYIFLAILYAFFNMIVLKTGEKKQKELLELRANMQEQLLEQLKQNEIVHYLSLQNQNSQKQERELIRYLKGKHTIEKWSQNISLIQMILKESYQFLFLTIGIYKIHMGEISLIHFLNIETIGMYLINALDDLVNIFPKEKYIKGIIRKNGEFFQIEEEKEEEQKIELGDIVLNKVSFSYNEYQYVIKDISMQITQNSHVLFYGKSGCGKSTICKLLTKTITQTSGSIFIGKNNLADLTANVVRKYVTYLNQRSTLIKGTIKENIIMERPFHTSRFMEVCQICHLEEIVEKRPLRYETTITSQENNFSGGEKQRIILARTLYQDATIYLFDEPLSEVDEKLEKDIIIKMREFLKNKTIIYISHRNLKKLFDEVKQMEECHERILV